MGFRGSRVQIPPSRLGGSSLTRAGRCGAFSSLNDPLYVHQGAFRLPERVRPRGHLRSRFAVILKRCTAAARVSQFSFARIQLPPTGLARDSARRRHPASAPPEGARVSSPRPLAVLCGSGGARPTAPFLARSHLTALARPCPLPTALVG